ncbi:Nn.00g097490.m01.CDS01 [Neocucurbitaria sp. VM-36]
MLYSTLIVAASAFAGFASAQNSTANTPIACCTVPVTTVPESQRNEWCTANENTCVDLCGGQGEIASNGNECESDDLSFTCKCSNGTDISSNLADYQQSVPGLMCRYWFDACINATGTDASLQFQCIQARDTQCGNQTIDDDDSSSTASASASSTASRTSGSSASSTASDAASSSTAAAATLALYGTPALAGGLLALFGLAL